MKIMFILGRIVFGIPFIVFGIFHFLYAKEMAFMIPKFLPGHGFLWVYIFGASLVAAGLSFIARAQMFLAGFLLALLLAMFIIFIDIPALNKIYTNSAAMANLLKDIALLGGALMIASDKS